jgi:hypothetical protein
VNADTDQLKPLTAELDRYDWRQFKSFVGDGSSLPSALLALVSAESAEVAKQAYWRIDNVAMVQGRLSQSAEPLSGCLVKGLFVATPPARRYLFDLLATIAGGYEDHVDISEVGPVSIARCIEPMVQSLDVFESELSEKGDPSCVDILLMCALNNSTLKERVRSDLERALASPLSVSIRSLIQNSLADLES